MFDSIVSCGVKSMVQWSDQLVGSGSPVGIGCSSWWPNSPNVKVLLVRICFRNKNHILYLILFHFVLYYFIAFYSTRLSKEQYTGSLFVDLC
jgi:hypothetical protein